EETAEPVVAEEEAAVSSEEAVASEEAAEPEAENVPVETLIETMKAEIEVLRAEKYESLKRLEILEQELIALKNSRSLKQEEMATKPSIMIVEDVASVRGFVATSLRSSGYNVIEASDGIDALAKLSESKVDLIVSEANMPRMDGIAFIRELKKTYAYKLIPIVILTTENDEKRKEEAYSVGAKAWILKPFKIDSFIEIIKDSI
ncbi:MAG: response regulator, partial [Candidatus Magnetoovum sp. WYHC-5]|nr:response regulator [Candidatus Magnetoovum sp. WYHC-5]